MYLALFSLLSAVGAWAAWRSNPLYSRMATLRFIVAIVIGAAVVVGIMLAALNLTAKSSPAVSGTTLALAVLAGTIFFIWIIIAASTPKVPALPPGTTLVRVHREKLIPYVRWFFGSLLVLGLLAVLVPGDWKIAVGVVAGMLGFLGIILLITGYIAALGFDRSLSSVESDSWVHWTYTPEQWQAWTDTEVARLVATPPQWVWRRDWKRIVLPIVLVVGGVYLFDPGSIAWRTGYLCALFVLMGVMIEISNWYAKAAPARLRRLIASAKPESYFGSSGMYTEGTYTQWLTVSNYLVEATIDEREPRSIDLLFEKIVPGAYAGPIAVYRHVLIPPGAASDNDIARLQGLLSAACPSASVSLASDPAPAATVTAGAE
jgi:hypothetical protein